MNAAERAWERSRCALVNGLVADALSMPVHWFYNVNDIYRYFGPKGERREESIKLSSLYITTR